MQVKGSDYMGDWETTAYWKSYKLTPKGHKRSGRFMQTFEGIENPMDDQPDYWRPI